MNLQEIQLKADSLFDTMVEARRYLHMNPEVGGAEFKTQEYIMNFLNHEGIACKKIADTGVLAWVDGKGAGNVVALRSDIDALPMEEKNETTYCSLNKGFMHACGHDAHTAINLGCAKFFNDNSDKFSGTVKFFFQPAEENIGGAKRMIDEGCMNNPKVDFVIGLHVTPYFDYNKIEVKYGVQNSSTNTIKLTVKGKSGHGAYPDECVDAIIIAAQILVALQSIVSRNVSPLESAVLTFGKIVSGEAPNVISDEVELTGTVRCSGIEVEKLMLDKVKTISESIAFAMGGECKFETVGLGYLPLVNDDSILDMIIENAATYLGADNVVYKKSISMGGEDFSFFNSETKGSFYNLGCKIDGREPYALHTRQFDIDERCLKTGLVLQVMNTLKLLEL